MDELLKAANKEILGLKEQIANLQTENGRLREEMNQLIDIAMKIRREVIAQTNRIVGRPNQITEPSKKKIGWKPEDTPLRSYKGYK